MSSPGFRTRRVLLGSRRCICALLIPAYLSACTSWRVPAASPERLIAEDHPDRIRVVLEDETTLDLYQPAVVGDTLRGFLERPGKGAGPPPSRHDVLLADIATVKVRATDATKSLLLGLGIVTGVTVAALGLYAIACGATRGVNNCAN